MKSENGPNFTSREFEQYLISREIEQRKSISYWPKRNGEVECFQRTLLKQNRAATRQKKRLEGHLIQ